MHKHDEEMGLLACALEMVYRANRGRVALSFQDIGDSILPLFVEMIRWSSVRRKDIWINMHLEAQIAAENQMMQQAKKSAGNASNKSGASVAASGIYYSGVNGHANNKHNSNDGHSLVSILKSDSNDHPADCPPTPLISNGSNRGDIDSSSSECSSRLPDRLQDITAETEITIECIPNGSETESFADVSKGNREREPHDGSTESTSTTSELDTLKDAQSTPSPEMVGRQRERQVRFSDMVDSNLKPTTLTPLEEDQPKQFIEPEQYNGIPARSVDVLLERITAEGKKVWKKEKYTHPLAVLKVLKVLRYFSRVLSAMVPMAHFPGLLDELIFQMKIRKINENTKDSMLRPRGIDIDDDSYYSARSNDIEIGVDSKNAQQKKEASKKRNNSQHMDSASMARMDAIAIVVNLACAEENKTKLLQHPNLLEAVVHVAQHDVIDDAREHASIVLMNLALAEGNKVSPYFDLPSQEPLMILTYSKHIFRIRYSCQIMITYFTLSQNS